LILRNKYKEYGEHSLEKKTYGLIGYPS